MHKAWKLVTWATAIVYGFVVSGILYNISQISNRSDEYVKPDLGSLILAIAAGFSMQIGLFVSPFVISRNILLRLFSFVLMIPFVYFVLLHDIGDMGRQIIDFDNYRLEDWRINLGSYFAAAAMTVVCSVVYGYNILLLLFRRRRAAYDDCGAR